MASPTPQVGTATSPISTVSLPLGAGVMATGPTIWPGPSTVATPFTLTLTAWGYSFTKVTDAAEDEAAPGDGAVPAGGGEAMVVVVAVRAMVVDGASVVDGMAVVDGTAVADGAPASAPVS